MIETTSLELSNSSKRDINSWLKKFPITEKRSAIMPALTIVQKENGGALTEELITAVARYLDVPEAFVYELATFYKMYELGPVGRHKIAVCTNVSCMLCGCNKVALYLKEKLNIDFGEITKDGRFMLQEVECLGVCDGAPAMLVDSKCYTDLTPEKIDSILKGLK